MNQNIPAITTLAAPRARFRLLVFATALTLISVAPASSLASPEVPGSGPGAAATQNVDYISAGSGAALTPGFPVLVPGFVPAPFSGSPSIDAGGGYYSLYWMNSGGDPTFLQVTGQAGGVLPAGSPYDLNVELFINAGVQGYDAIHDVTPAYDAVWWIAGGVLYKVESRNSGTGSLALANSLITFVPPVALEPTSPPAAPTVPEPPPSDPGVNSGGSTTNPESPAGETGQSTSDQDSGTSPTSITSQLPDAPDDSSAPTTSSSTTDEDAPDLVPLGSDGTGDPAATSDGTGGAQVAVIGGDGTGGTNVVMIPRPPDPQTP